MIKKIDQRNFKPYGRIIEYPGKKSQSRTKNLFRVVYRESKPLGWRIAYLVVRDKKLNRLEQHPNTCESFEPVSGKTLLYLALPGNPIKIECFLLDKPVILHKSIWHGVVTLGDESEIKITENAQVSSIYRHLPS